jgi:hypothetical protein
MEKIKKIIVGIIALAAVLGAAPAFADSMQIYVKTLQGKTIPIEAADTSTIGAVKLLVQEQEGIPADQQRLLYGGKQLEDARTLAYYEIEQEGVIHLLMRLSLRSMAN